MAKRKPTRVQLSELISEERTKIIAARREGGVEMDAQTRLLLNGRLTGLHDAEDLLWGPDRWTPTTRREVHAQIVDQVERVVDAREAIYIEHSSMPEVAAGLAAQERGKIDALMALASAMYGNKELLRGLHHVGDAPTSTRRQRDRDHGLGE